MPIRYGCEFKRFITGFQSPWLVHWFTENRKPFQTFTLYRMQLGTKNKSSIVKIVCRFSSISQQIRLVRFDQVFEWIPLLEFLRKANIYRKRKKVGKFRSKYLWIAKRLTKIITATPIAIRRKKSSVIRRLLRIFFVYLFFFFDSFFLSTCCSFRSKLQNSIILICNSS